MKSLRVFLRERLDGVKRLTVLGVGSVLRADDAAGMQVVENLAAILPREKYPAVQLCAGETAPENFSGKIKSFSPTHLLIVDAADLGQSPGSIVDIRPQDVGGPTFCSHMLPLKVMIDYIVDGAATQVILLGIQYESIEFDADMTDAVHAAVGEVCQTLKGVIDELLCIQSSRDVSESGF